MIDFKEKKIDTEIAADLIRNARMAKKLDLQKIANTLKINIKYLEALESGTYSNLPKGLYGKSFIREYATYLKLNPNDIVKMYEAETEGRKSSVQEDLFSKKVPKSFYFLTVPKIVKNFLIVFSVTIVLLYLGYYIKNLLNQPSLVVYSPEKDDIIKEHTVEIKGKTELEAEITINSETILADREGYFNKTINLSDGVNIINISAKKKYSKENKIIRKIIVE